MNAPLSFRMLSESEKLEYVELANALLSQSNWSGNYRAYKHLLLPVSETKLKMMVYSGPGALGMIGTLAAFRLARFGFDLLNTRPGIDQQLIKFFGTLEQKHHFKSIDTGTFPRFPEDFAYYIHFRGIYDCTPIVDEIRTIKARLGLGERDKAERLGPHGTGLG